MRLDSPRDHPTFRRALLQCQRELMGEGPSLAPQPQPQPEEPALGEISALSFELAADALYQHAPLRGSLSYSISGAQFARDGLTQIQQSQSDPLLELFQRALREAGDTLPQLIHTRIDFGLYEDGLLFGASSSECEGGDFSALNRIIEAGIDNAARLSTLAKLREDGVPDSLAETLALQLSEELKPNMRAFALRSFPLGVGPRAKPLCCLAEDLALRSELLEEAIFHIEGQGGMMPGPSAALAIRVGSERVTEALPFARELSRFKMKLGI